MPVVEFSSGNVRELTPVEAEFESPFRFEEAGYGDVLWNPGPRGWGMWWEDQREREMLWAERVFSRLRWRDKQEEELGVAAWAVSLGLAMLLYVDWEVWEVGIGEPLVHLMEWMEERYPLGERGYWSGVPGRWVCADQLEVALTQGVTQGCPGEEYEALLRESWVRLGVVADLLLGIGRVIQVADGMNTGELYDSEVRSRLGFYVLDLGREWGRMESAFRDMREGTAWRGLPVDVEFFDPDW